MRYLSSCYRSIHDRLASAKSGHGHTTRRRTVHLTLEALESRALPSAAGLLPSYDMGTPTLIDIWVDPVHGVDGNGGATRAQALQTITAAWNLIPQGSTLTTGYRIDLVSGTYSAAMTPNYWQSRYGTFQDPVIIQAADGPGTVSLPAMSVYDCRYFYLIGLNVSAGGGDVLHVDSCNHVLVRQTNLAGIGDIANYDGPQEDLKANQSQYVYVEGCDIAGAWNNPVDFVAVQYGHVVGNKIHHSLDWAMYVKGGSAYLTVAGNEIYDAGTGGFTAGQGSGLEFMVAPWIHYEAYDIQFIDNVIHDTDGAGMGVNGGYDILLAYNTLYRVGRRSHVIEVVQGARSCDGNQAACRANLAVGGWGTAVVGASEPIPDKSVFIYNNVVYNPTGYQSQWQQFNIAGPATPHAGSNIPSPALAADNLQIRGNIIWNGPADLPLGIDDANLAAQVTADNTINTILPQLTDPANGDFRPLPGGNVFTAQAVALPDFSWSDAPQRPAVPVGNLSNLTAFDRDGNPRNAGSSPGAYAGGNATSPQAPQSPTLPFTDAFAQANGTALANNNWALQQGNFTVQNNAAAGVMPVNYATLVGVVQSDVMVSGTLSLGVNHKTVDGGGLIARAGGPANSDFYMGVLWQDASHHLHTSIMLHKNGRWTTLKTGAVLPATRGTVEFDVIGSSLRLFFNGKLVASAHDTHLAAGSVGMRSNAGVSWSNFNARAGSR